MKFQGIDLEETIANAKEALISDKNIASSTKAVFNVLLILISILANQMGLNSKNSSIPPSQDPNRKKRSNSNSGKNKGGQKGHKGVTLNPYEDVDESIEIQIDRRTLPKGKYTDGGFEFRQVVDIEINRIVTEYKAQVLINGKGKRFVASFPVDITRPIQYGPQLKAHAVYMSQYQLLPYNRIEEYFRDQLEIPISAGSLFNFNLKASDLLKEFNVGDSIKSELINSVRIHADETGININKDRHWLHCQSDDLWTYMYPHKERGTTAMDFGGVIPLFAGILCHDHWKSYYTYNQCLHSLCNAHHLRELDFSFEKEGQKWAKEIRDLLIAVNTQVKEEGGKLKEEPQKVYLEKYREILSKAEIECPPPDESKRLPKQRGRLKRSKSRNLLERLINYESDVFRFMTNENVPFTNNQGERDIRMVKVQQKISGCFRSFEGAKIFCEIRSYLSSCRKQNVSATYALSCLFNRKLPDIF
jgi:transposase